MITESQFHIPCLCGTTVLSHARETRCEECGRLLAVEWGNGREAEPDARMGVDPDRARRE